MCWLHKEDAQSVKMLQYVLQEITKTNIKKSHSSSENIG
jgi:hypothetical protein